MDKEAGEITERLEALERSMRRYRAALVAVAIVAAAGFVGLPLVGAAKSPGVIQAKGFEVLDDSGTVRAGLGVTTGGPRLRLYDKGGTPRVMLDAVGDAAGLVFADKAGKPRASLVTLGDEAELVFDDKAGKARANLATAGEGAALRFYDKAGTPRAGLVAVAEGAALRLYDKAGKSRAALGNFDLELPATAATEHRAESSLVLLNQEGRVLWKAP